MRQKRGKFLTFICSLIPGAAEMYMGFMKTGISLMTVFAFCWVLPYLLRLSDVFIFFGFVTWFYSFFHARNLVVCNEEAFQTLEDEYVWTSFLEGRGFKLTNPAIRKWGAVALIVYGITLLWDAITHWIYFLIPDSMWDEVSMIVDGVPQVLVALVIIIIGIKLIAGKKEELNGEGK